jgi:hypothetical protein
MLVMPDAAASARIQQPGFVDRDRSVMKGQSFERAFVTGTQVSRSRPLDFTEVVAGSTILGWTVGRSPASAAAGLGVGLGVGLGLGLVTGAIVVEARHSTAAVLRAFGEMPVAEVLVNDILEVGRSYRVLPPIEDRPDTGAPAVDTFLELESPRVSLTSDDITVWSPDLQLRLAVGAKLVRASDREELAHWSWEHKGPAASLSDWSQDDAHLFRMELDRALRAIALQAIKDVAPDPVQAHAGEETLVESAPNERRR